MALEIFKLVGSIFVDNEKANQSIAKTDEKAEGVGKKLASGVQTAAKWGAAIGGAAIAAGTALYGAATKAAENADEIDKMSQKIGISRQAYQELDYVLSQNGMDVNKLQSGMKSLTNAMAGAQDGTGATSEAFEALGVSVTNADGSLRSSESVFYDSIAALQGMENETERNALANQLFGKSATEMLPLLNSGAGSMEELTQKAHELGLVMDDDLIDNGVSLTDTLDTLKRALGAAATKLGGALMPLVEKAANFLIDNLPFIQNLFETLTPVITDLAEQLLPPLMQLVTSLLPLVASLIQALLPPITTILTTLLPPLIQLLDTLLPPIIQIVEKLLPPLLELLDPILQLLGPIIELLEPILALVTDLIDPLIKLAVSVLTPLINVITTLIGKALGPLKTAFGAVADVIKGVLGKAFDFIGDKIAKAKEFFGNIIDFVKNVFTGNWKGAWENVKNIFSSIAEGIGNAFKAPINFIIGAINGFIRGLNKLTIPDWVPVVGGKGFHINEIPKLARGGVLERGQTGYLEGDGAEAVVPLENNKKWLRNMAQDLDSITNSKKTNEQLVGLLALILKAVEDLDLGMYVDGKKLVGAIGKDMDKELGRINKKKARA